MAIPLKVAVYKGSDFIGEQRYDRDIIKIGRLASAHLKLEDPKVSRIHAVIEVSSDGQELSIIDMGSSDGTFVNGERISKEKLRDGDEVRVGDCRLVVSLDDAPAKVDPAAAAAAASAAAAAAAMQWSQLAPENAPTGVFSPISPQQMADMARAQAWGTPPAPDANAGFAAAVPMPAPMLGGATALSPSPVLQAQQAALAQQQAALAQQQAYAQQAAYAQQQAQQAFEAQQQGYPQQAQGYGMQAQAAGYPQQAYGVPPGYPAGALPFPSEVPAPALPMNGQDVAYPAQGWYPPAQHGAWGTVPNNLASEGVPENERALELKLVWGDSVLRTVNVTDEPLVTMGDQELVVGWGPFKQLKTCDLEVPSKGLPMPRYPIAVSQSKSGATYGITLHTSFAGHIERTDGALISLADLVQSGRAPAGELPDTWVYTLKPEETLYVKHGLLTVQARYVRRTRLAAIPFMEAVNYTWLNTIILVAFFHGLIVAALLAQPRNSESLEDQLFKNPNRIAQFLLTPEQKKKQESFLAKLKAGDVGAKARKDEGKAGKKDFDKNKPQGRMAVKAVDPTDKEIAKSTLQKLFDNGNRSASYMFGTGGLGGELKGALGGVTGAQIGDAAGLGGLGARGAGPGGGGMAMNSVGLGALGTQGRGGGGDGSYGTGVGNVGKKSERDINITAGTPTIMGSLDKELIRKVIEAHKAQIRYCYEKELVRTPGLFGKIDMEWTIGGDGLVKDSKPKTSTMNNPEVERCIAQKIRTWEFPKPKGGGIVIVRYPFVFKTSG